MSGRAASIVSRIMNRADRERTERIRAAARLCADVGGSPDMAYLPSEMYDDVDCAPDRSGLHVYPSDEPGARCKCGVFTICRVPA